MKISNDNFILELYHPEIIKKYKALYIQLPTNIVFKWNKKYWGLGFTLLGFGIAFAYNSVIKMEKNNGF